jgi:hypothetical protein
MSQMISISYERHVLVLKMPFDELCIADIKSTIPPNMREWHSALKVWFIGLPYLPTLINILKRYFDSSDIYVSRDIPNLIALKDVIEPLESPYSDLYLLPNAPKEVAYAAYRALAKMYHPDTGRGDLEKMKRINLAWERIRA